MPLGRRCIELPAGLVGDEDDSGSRTTALKELEEETGFVADADRAAGRFLLVAGHGRGRLYIWSARMACGRAAARPSEEIDVHLVAPADMAGFIADKRAEAWRSIPNCCCCSPAACWPDGRSKASSERSFVEPWLSWVQPRSIKPRENSIPEGIDNEGFFVGRRRRDQRRRRCPDGHAGRARDERERSPSPTISCSPTGRAPMPAFRHGTRSSPSSSTRPMPSPSPSSSARRPRPPTIPKRRPLPTPSRRWKSGGARLDQVGSIFGVMTDNMSTPEYQALDKKWSPKLSAAFDRITLDPKTLRAGRNAVQQARQPGARRQANARADPHL